jgi:hypothetical protein
VLVGARQLLNVPPGVNKDDNSYTAINYTDADKIRFNSGLPETIGGWAQGVFGNYQTLTGVCRTLYSYIGSTGIETVFIGTHKRLYALQSNNLYNITPLVTITTAIANSLTTNYATMGNDPISITNGSRVVTLTYSTLTQGIFQIGDIVQVSGVAGAIGGIAAATLNGIHSITSVSASVITFVVSTTATSTATGGGAAVVLSTRVLTVAQIAHGFASGDRIKILGAIDFRGFIAADINTENIIRNVSANEYSYYMLQTANFATSSGGTGGGATTVQGQIAAGNCTFSAGLGYGGGNYSAGTYGTAKVFNSGYTLPRIWSIDRYGNGVILTPGNQSALYEWDGDYNTAPTIVSGAPSVINYCFVANNQAITFGAANVANAVKTSDTLDITNWTIDATSTAYEAEIQGAGRLIAHSFIKDQWLLFTESSVFTMVYVGKPDIWLIQELTTADGVISPKSIIQVNDAVVWWGHKDFYIYNGSVLTQIPNNTLKNWAQTTLNSGKYYLIFARKVIEFNEVWWHFPSGSSSEPDAYVIWNYLEGHWTNGTMDRTAAEEPHNPARAQWMAYGVCDGSTSTTLYRQEVGYSADGAALTGSLTSNYAQVNEGNILQQITRIIPSPLILPLGTSNTGQTLYTITLNAKNYDGQSTFNTYGPFDVTGFTQKIETRVVGRQRQYIIDFSTTTGFRIQKMYEELKPTTQR